MDERAGGSIELHLRVISQMFDSLDPSPFHEQDLALEAEQYIVESAKEMPGQSPRALRIHVDEPMAMDDRMVAAAVRVHFDRRAQRLRLQLRELLGRGWVSLGIGLAILVLFFLIGQLVARRVGEGPWALLARESLLIGGWVAMWRPLEIFLYDWWPIVRERKLAERLSRMEVRVERRNP